MSNPKKTNAEKLAELRARYPQPEPMTDLERNALERLFALTDENGTASQIAAELLMAWHNSPVLGGFGLHRLWELDEQNRCDALTVIGLAARIRQYPDALGYQSEMIHLIRKWRTQ